MHLALARRGKDVLDAPADEAGAARTALTSGIVRKTVEAQVSINDVMIPTQKSAFAISAFE